MTTGTAEINQIIECDICVIGGGSGGLSTAAGAAQMGAKVVLIERAQMGGDCLNTGCVPSKSLIAAAHKAHSSLTGAQFGVYFHPPHIEFKRVHDHIHEVIASIAPHDSVERFESLGIRVLKESATFNSADEVLAGPYRVRARRFVVATGSRAAIPPVKGLAGSKPLTNETVFDLTELPSHLIVLGGGPIGLEMAQSFRRLGAAVTILERLSILPRDEPEASERARAALLRDGVILMENVEVTEVRSDCGGVRVDIVGLEKKTVSGSHILVAAGRIPNTEALNLEAAGIAFGPRGIAVDSRLRSSNHNVFAIGDVSGGPQFTHIAAYHAGIVIQNALLGLPAKVNYHALPWVTYLDPEIAHVGLTESEAKKQHGTIKVLQENYSENDRARAERRTEGYVKIVVGRRGRVLGATIVAPHAGEMIALWGLAISKKLPISAIAGMIVPYPTMSELSKRVAGSYFTPSLYGKRMRRFVKLVQRWLP